jgi:hypothetical protein
LGNPEKTCFNALVRLGTIGQAKKPNQGQQFAGEEELPGELPTRAAPAVAVGSGLNDADGPHKAATAGRGIAPAISCGCIAEGYFMME